MQQSDSTTTQKPARYGLRWLLGIGAVLVLLLGTGAVLLSMHWPFSQQKVTDSLQQGFPVKVTFGSFKSVYFPHPGCEGTNVVFKHLAHAESLPPVATIEKFRIEARYIDLFLRPGYLAKLVLIGFHLHVPAIGTPRQQTSWTPGQNSSLRIAEVIADDAVLEIARAEGHDPLVFAIHKAKLASVSRNQALNYEVAFRNPLPPGEIQSNGIFGPWNSTDPGQTPVNGRYSFENADLSVFHGISGSLTARDKFQGTLGHIETRAGADIPDFKVDGASQSIHLKAKFSAIVNGTNGDVQLEQVTANFLGTQVQAQGQIAGHPGQKGKTAALNVSTSNGRIQDVLTLFVHAHQAPLDGATNFQARILLPPGSKPFLQRVRLTGDFSVSQAHFTKDATQEKIDSLSERARGEKVKTVPAVATAASSDPVLANLNGHVDLRDAQATFSDLSFDLPGAKSQMHGTYNIETKKVDLHGELKTEATLSEMAGGGTKSALLKPFNGLFKKKHAGAVVPVHLTGSYQRPQAGLDLPLKKGGGGSAKTAASN
jgi:AsmA-like C-terminal region